MATRRTRRWTWITFASGALTFQFAGCFGGDPAAYFTGIVSTTLVSELVGILVGLVTSGLQTA